MASATATQMRFDVLAALLVLDATVDHLVLVRGTIFRDEHRRQPVVRDATAAAGTTGCRGATSQPMSVTSAPCDAGADELPLLENVGL